MGIGDFVLGSDPGAAGPVGVLSLGNELGAPRQSPGRNVKEGDIAKNIVHGVAGGYVFCVFTDDEGQLRFGLINHDRRNIQQLHGAFRADQVRGLVEKLIG